MASQGRPWSGKTGGGNFGQKALIYLLSYVSVTVFYPFLMIAIPFYWIFDRKSARSVYTYFYDILHYNRWKSLIYMVRNYTTFGQVVLDKFALLTRKEKQFSVQVADNDQIEKILHQDQGLMIASAHIGNFELIGHCYQQNEKQINCVVYGGESDRLQQKKSRSFEKNHIHLISFKEDMSHLFAITAALNQGDIVAISCDRIYGSPKSVKVNFLGHEALFPIGPFRLAAHTGVPVFSVFIMKEKRTKYQGYAIHLDVDRTDKTPSEIAKLLAIEYAKSLEKILLQYPEQWFNYYDFWNIKS